MAETGNTDANRRQQRIEAALAVLDAGDTYSLCEWVAGQGAAADVLTLYHDLSQALYGKRRAVRSTIAVARAGIHFGLTEAARLEKSDPELAARLRGQVKAISYDLGANLWPGWQDEGVVLTSADLETGLEAARLNLRLAEELGRPPLALCNAHWLLGAHELARGEGAAARDQFTRAIEQARLADRADFRSMATGYAAIASLQIDGRHAAAELSFAAAVRDLEQLATDDSKYFAEQLRSVRTYFLSSPKLVP